ncbi:ATP-binding protein [Enterocloster clostridioformis]|uniref:ATP-binding protein n=1 Tax=Enterocloster clostridioformis TaxID=1531 RepID=UPI0004042A9D|nr:ATP-binding protein [Enterocloster clostridioformis]
MKLVKILSDSVQIRTNLSEFRDIRINDLLSVSDGEVSLVTMVTGLTDTDSEERIGEEDFLGEITGIKSIDCTIIGSLKDGRFLKAIDVYPTTNVSICRIGIREFEDMLGRGRGGFRIGTYAAYSCDAVVDGNKFFQRHSCIVGNTGAGKSETVAKILEETAKLPGANLVVFDIHGEYSQLSYASNIRIGEDFPFPIWMFGFNDIVANILKIREESATTVMTALRKAYYRVCPDGKENKPVYFSYQRLIDEMESLDNHVVTTGEVYKTGDKAGMAKTTKGEYNGKLTSTVNLLKDRMMDSRYSFLFEEKLQSYLYEVMEAVLGTDKPVKNIDLSGVPHDVALPIIGVISRLIFDIQRQQDMDSIRPVTIVCDEAHVYIPDNFQLTASQRRMVEVFEDIAKEGRKFGITLFPATQRPSELNKTIVAQCANMIIGKLNNENDKALIKGMLPDGGDKIIDSVTMFNPGEVLIVGDAVPIPLKIKVELARERPVSRTIDFWDVWSQERDYDIAGLVDRYM